MHHQLPTYSRILKRKPPSILFHYTNPTGLVGIARSKNIWATDIKFLNDKKEFQHSLDITHSIIASFYKVNNEPKLIDGRAYDFVEYLSINLRENWTPKVYVASFTEEGDLLSQWRGYCPKGGFSIGFHYDFISQLAVITNSFLLPCVYDEKTQKQMLEELFISYSKKYVDSTQDTYQKNSDELANGISREFIISLFAIAPMIKHSSFKEEKEWRIVFPSIMGEHKIQFRATESNIIPYIEMPLCHGDKEIEINKIFIAPSSNNQYSKEAVLQLLGDYKVKDSAIQMSESPYRC